MTSSQKLRMSSGDFPAKSDFDSCRDALGTLNAYLPTRASITGIGVVWPSPMCPRTSRTAQPSHRLGLSNESSSSSCRSLPMSATSSHIIAISSPMAPLWLKTTCVRPRPRPRITGSSTASPHRVVTDTSGDRRVGPAPSDDSSAADEVEVVRQLVDVEGFGQVVVGARLPPLPHLLVGGLGGEQHDGDVARARIALQGGKHVVTVAARHHDIEQDHIWADLGDECFHADPILGDVDAVALVAEVQGYELPDVGVVVDQEARAGVHVDAFPVRTRGLDARAAGRRRSAGAWSPATGAFGREGTRRTKVHPPPGVSSSCNDAPRRVASSRHRNSPRPVPPCLRLAPWSSWTNRSNARSRSPGGIPGPWSTTAMVSAVPSSSTTTSMGLPGAYFSAFDTRLPTIWRMRSWSDSTGPLAAVTRTDACGAVIRSAVSCAARVTTSIGARSQRSVRCSAAATTSKSSMSRCSRCAWSSDVCNSRSRSPGG